jgi:hypothetical protein
VVENNVSKYRQRVIAFHYRERSSPKTGTIESVQSLDAFELVIEVIRNDTFAGGNIGFCHNFMSVEIIEVFERLRMQSMLITSLSEVDI